VIGSVLAFVDAQGALEDPSRAFEVAGLVQFAAQVGQAHGHQSMVGTERPLPDGQRTLI
jgi:hypothetical protein